VKTALISAFLFVVVSLICPPGYVAAREEISGEMKKEIVVEYLEKVLDRARKKAGEKHFEDALDLARAVRLLARTPQIAGEAERNIENIENSRIQYLVLESEILTDREIYEAGDKLVLTARLYNRSMSSLRIPLLLREERRFIFWKKKVTRPNRIYLTLSSKDYDHLGGLMLLTQHRTEEFAEEILLQPGEFWERRIEVELPASVPGAGSVRELKIGLLFSPLFLKKDNGEELRHRFRTVEAKVSVLPRGAAACAGNPVQSACEALAKRDGISLLYSVVCADRVQRARLVPLIIEQLHKTKPNSPMERSLIVCLQHITGFYGRLQKKVWLEWWRDRGRAFVASVRPEAQPNNIEIDIAADGTYTCGGQRKSLDEIESMIKEARVEGLLNIIARCSAWTEYRHLNAIQAVCQRAGAEHLHFAPAGEQDGSETDE